MPQMGIPNTVSVGYTRRSAATLRRAAPPIPEGHVQCQLQGSMTNRTTAPARPIARSAASLAPPFNETCARRSLMASRSLSTHAGDASRLIQGPAAECPAAACSGAKP